MEVVEGREWEVSRVERLGESEVSFCGHLGW